MTNIFQVGDSVTFKETDLQITGTVTQVADDRVVVLWESGETGTYFTEALKKIT